MRFCPKCETRMKPKVDEGIIKCPKCGFSSPEKEEEKSMIIGGSAVFERPISESSLKVMETDNDQSGLPTTSIECPKCKNNSAFWWMLQTRSADEPTTQFFRCTKCSHTWRNYA